MPFDELAPGAHSPVLNTKGLQHRRVAYTRVRDRRFFQAGSSSHCVETPAHGRSRGPCACSPWAVEALYLGLTVIIANRRGGPTMATQTKRNVPQVVHGPQPTTATAQTPGMVRRPAIHKETVGASKIWFGTVTCTPNHKGPPHHHGEAETAAYVISGHIRVYYGEGFKEFVEAGPGRLYLRARPTRGTSRKTHTTNHRNSSSPVGRTTSSLTWSSRGSITGGPGAMRWRRDR